MRIDQLVIGAWPGDAITSMAFEIQSALAAVGDSDVYGYRVHPDLKDRARPMADLKHDPDRLLVYHASIGEPDVTRFLLRQEQPFVLVYHNITPARHFLSTRPDFAALLEWGRRELELIRPRVRLAIADSHFNADELVDLGYSDVRVVPAGIDPHRLLALAPDPHTHHVLEGMGSGPIVLAVAQLLAHKRADLVVQVQHVLETYLSRDESTVLVGFPRTAELVAAVDALRRRLGVRRLWMAGAVSERALATLYRRATSMVSTSEHEGFCLPAVEAMAFGVPVVARGFGALTDTIGPAGIVLPPDSGVCDIAEAVALLHDDPILRRHVVDAGYRRAAEFSRENCLATFLDHLVSAV